MEGHFEFGIQRVDVCAICRYAPETNFNAPAFPAVDNVHGGGVVSVRLSVNNGSGRISRPLIVAEGFDVWRIFDDPNLNYNFESIIASINTLGGANPTSYDFNTALDDVGGYDLVFLDYNNGTDDIRRNAALLQEVIRWVNGQKQAGDAQNVVMGLSMGGLVARYGLAQMVKNGENPQTRLLITHDSPHRGANVPVGLQLMVGQLQSVEIAGQRFREIIPQLDQAVTLFNEPATQQLLTYRTTAVTDSFASNTFLDNEYRTMITFGSGGPQPQYQMVATSNGSQCGVQLFAPGTEIARIDGDARGLVFFGLLFGRTYRMDMITNGLPASGTSGRIFYYKLRRKDRVFFGLIPTGGALSEISVTSNGTLLPLDGAAGGTYGPSDLIGSDLPEVISGGSTNSLLGFLFAPLFMFGYDFKNKLKQDFCFVPTGSALDVTTYNVASLSARSVHNIHAGNSRFPKFIAQEQFPANSRTLHNESHIRFTARNSHWLFDEMQLVAGNTRGCTTECTSPLALSIIAGSDFLCNASTYTISPALPAGFTVTWTTNNANVGITSSGVATRLNNYSGPVTISATVVSPCENRTFTKTVSVSQLTGTYGYGSASGYTLAPNNNVRATGITVAINPAGLSNIVWQRVSTSAVQWSASGNLLNFTLPPYGGAAFKVTATSCGTVLEATYAFYNTSGSATFRLYPNPADGEATVEAVEPGVAADAAAGQSGPDGGPAADAPVRTAKHVKAEVEVFDKLQQKVAGGPLKEGRLVLDTRRLPDGVYFVRIREGDHVEVHQLKILR